MTFSATLRRTGCGLLGHEDGAHAALADLLQQLVRADRPCPGAFAGRGGASTGARRAARPPSRRRRPAAPGSCRPRGGPGAGARPAARSSASPPQASVDVARPTAPAAACRPRRRNRFAGSSRRSAGMATSLPVRHHQCGFEAGFVRRGIAKRIRPGLVGRLAVRAASRSQDPGVGPVLVGGASARCRRTSAASSSDQAGEVAELDQPGGLAGPRRPAGSGPRRGRAGRRPARCSRRRRRRGRRAGRRPPRLSACLRRACSTRMRRMASAAAAKKWPRPFQCWALLAADEPQVRLVDQGGGLERLARLLRRPSGRPRASAARRRRAAAARAAACGSPAAAAARSWVTSAMSGESTHHDPHTQTGMASDVPNRAVGPANHADPTDSEAPYAAPRRAVDRP